VRAFLSFAGGFVGGAVVIYLTCQLGFALVYGGPEQLAWDRHITVEQAQEWVDRRVIPGFLMITVAGAIPCGLLCAAQGRRPARPPRLGALAASPAHDHGPPPESPLTPEEFERVARAVLWRDVDGRSPTYLQGLLVGCLQDTVPELAAKIDRFSRAHVAALQKDLRRYRRRLA
jgi:hypothetical protein